MFGQMDDAHLHMTICMCYGQTGRREGTNYDEEICKQGVSGWVWGRLASMHASTGDGRDARKGGGEELFSGYYSTCLHHPSPLAGLFKAQL